MSNAPATSLDLATLRAANLARQEAWCPDQVPDLSFRGNELGGECGEAQNVIKKLERERLGWRGSRASTEQLAEELADVVICADLCAITGGVDLAAAVVAKFNATSDKVGIAVHIGADHAPPVPGPESGWWWFAGDNDEMYRTGPCESREAAIAEAIRQGTGREWGVEPAQHTIYLIEARQDPIDLSRYVDVDAFVERLHEQLGDDVGGEDGESPAQDAWNDAQHIDLETSLEQAVAAWQARHKIVVAPRQFTDSRNAERITLPETVAPPPDAIPLAAE